MKKVAAIVVVFLLFIGVFNVNTANADIVQHTDAAISDNPAQDIIQSFSSLTGTLITWKVKIDPTSDFSPPFVHLYENDVFVAQAVCASEDYNATTKILTFGEPNCSNNIGTFFGHVFSSTAITKINTHTGGGDSAFWYGSADANAYTGGLAGFNNNVSPVVDLWFELGGSDVIPIPTIDYPANNSTISYSPFTISGTCASTQGVTDVLVRFEDNVGTATGGAVDCISGVFSTTSEQFPVGFWNGSWLIFAKGLNSSGIPITEETSITFTIDVSNNVNTQPPTVTQEQDTSCTSGTLTEKILCRLRALLTFLFVPTQDATTRFATLKDQIENKPPFGYFTLAKEELEASAIGASGETLEGVTDLTDYFDPIRVVIMALLWILFTFWVLRRIQTVDI